MAPFGKVDAMTVREASPLNAETPRFSADRIRVTVQGAPLMSGPGRDESLNTMIDFTLHTHIDRPASDVFAYVSDPERLATWQTNTVSAVQETEGPMGLGTRLREVHRAPGNKELVSLVEVCEFEPGHVFALQVVEGTPVHLRITLDRADGGTGLRFRAHGRLTGAMRLAEPILGRVLKRQFAEQLATLKRLLEHAPVPA